MQAFEFRQIGGSQNQCITQAEFGFHIAYSHKTKVTDFAKARRQNVLHKPSYKLTNLQSHDFSCSGSFIARPIGCKIFKRQNKGGASGGIFNFQQDK